MSTATPKLSAASQATQRSAAARMLAYFNEDHSRLSPEDQEEKKKALVADLKRALSARVTAADFDSISAVVLSAPGIESGFIQQGAHLEQNNVVRVPGGAGAWIHGHIYRDGFRVFLQSSGKHIETTHADLLTAVREAFAALGVALPKALS